MAEEYHDPNKPLIGQVGEQDQESWQSMVQYILIVISFLSDKHVRK